MAYVCLRRKSNWWRSRFGKDIGPGGSVISSGIALDAFCAIGLGNRRDITKIKGVVPVDR